jgi:hypothetical protein
MAVLCQVISKIATIELPKSQWEELMPLLLQAVVQPEPTPEGWYLCWAPLWCTLQFEREMLAIFEVHKCISNTQTD